MACTEITQAIQWSSSGSGTEIHPVTAYFTKHFGFGGAYVAHKDSVHYAVGDVWAVNAPKPHLHGEGLKVFKNGGDSGEAMDADGSLTYEVDIFDDGTLAYLLKLHGKPVGGLAATKVNATCVKDDLLTAVSGGEVVAIGVARKPAVAVPT